MHGVCLGSKADDSTLSLLPRVEGSCLRVLPDQFPLNSLKFPCFRVNWGLKQGWFGGEVLEMYPHELETATLRYYASRHCPSPGRSFSASVRLYEGHNIGGVRRSVSMTVQILVSNSGPDSDSPGRAQGCHGSPRGSS